MTIMQGTRYLTWSWIIIVGALLITPKWIFCIKCGVPVDAPGYIGDFAVAFLGIGSIALGVIGFTSSILAAAKRQPLDQGAKPTQGAT